MTLQEHLLGLRRHMVLLLVAVLVGGGSAAAWSFNVPPTYTSQASLYFTSPVTQSPAQLNQGLSYVRRQILTYAELAESRAVLDAVVNELGLPGTGADLAERVEVRSPLDTVIVQVFVQDGDPVAAAAVATAVVTELGAQVARLSPLLDEGVPSLSASVVGPGVAPALPSAPRTRLDVLVGSLAGGLVGGVVALARESVRRARDLSTNPLLAGSVLVTLPGEGTRLRRSSHGGLPPEMVLRLAVERAERQALPAVVAVCGARDTDDPRELVRRATAAPGPRVGCVLVGTQDPATGRGARASRDRDGGLTDVLAGRRSLQAAVEPTSRSGQWVLPGEWPPETHGLRTAQVAHLLQQARSQFELTLVVLPPAATEVARVVAALSDSVLLVSRGQLTPSQATDIGSLMAIASAPPPLLVLAR